ncbi:hypothetical protein [Actinomadura sp. 7K507]|uniref:hypothetical protein n=1 Tax=Actinomadura sp. 7K507 TaxID=2530365 RepID=UPI001FB849CE|nr:hypothetical protein [Actinomadura sp. 7K507]
MAFTPVDQARVIPAGRPRLGARTDPGRQALTGAIQALDAAERPVVLAGEGLRWSRDHRGRRGRLPHPGTRHHGPP